MAEIDDANVFLAARNKTVWAGLTLEARLGLLAEAGDYLEASYVLIAPNTITSPTYLRAKYYLALAIHTNPIALTHSDAIQSKEDRLEGVATKKTTYAVTAKPDPYPFVTGILSGIAVRKNASGFQVVRLAH